MIATRDHGTYGENLKVHFAGAENMDFSYILKDAGVQYYLFTVLPFIMDQFNIKWGRITLLKEVFPHKELPKFAKHIIMDSGLFSLMFGACKDVRPDEKFIRRYKDAIVRFVLENKLDKSIACVECDCQKLLGTDLAWELRYQMRDEIPNTVINVFHFEDGKYGLDRLIEFSDYIAISVPELRIVKPKTYKEDTHRLASYIKNKKPEIDIHLLGCTELGMLKENRFCSSSDSTSWVSANRHGRICRHNVNFLKPEKMEEIRDRVRFMVESWGAEATPTRIKYLSNYWFAGHLLKYEYSKAAGNQD